jgi:SulP family sulfate permease
MPNFSEHLPELVKAGLVLALLGAIDSLLTSLVADNITQTSHNSNRELIGQGMANTAAGFLSGLPGAGATMRTVINIKSGGATPLSGMSHSLVLLVVLLGAGPLAAQIPTALLAGILIKVGLDIIDWGFLLRAHRLSGKTAVLMYSVLLMTVFWDLIWGVLVGMFVANLLTVDSITQTQLEGMDADNPPDAAEVRLHDLTTEEKSLVDQCGNALMLFRLRGPLSFGAAKGISARMGLIQNYKVLILDITEVPRIGISASLAIERMVQEAQTSGRTILIAGANSKLQQRLRQFGVHAELVNSRREALHIAAQDISV